MAEPLANVHPGEVLLEVEGASRFVSLDSTVT